MIKWCKLRKIKASMPVGNRRPVILVVQAQQLQKISFKCLQIQIIIQTIRTVVLPEVRQFKILMAPLIEITLQDLAQQKCSAKSLSFEAEVIKVALEYKRKKVNIDALAS